MSHDIRALTSAPFQPLLNQEVTLTRTGGGAFRARLTKVEDLPRYTMPGAPRTAFHLILKTDGPTDFASGDYVLAHEALGSIGPVHVERVFTGEPDQKYAAFQVSFS
ncbi:MAG TPA: hypothetical protein VED40_00065 [Azospirillaceae bacterium]|nr:hypothetical protein [Azospirillaceae bacterium]